MSLRSTVSKCSLLLMLPLAGCSTLQHITVLPGAGTQVLSAVGQTAQFKAFGAYQMGSATPTAQDITTTATWTAGNASVATINASGLATAVGAGNTSITAELNGVTATSDLTVTIAAGTVAPPSLTVTPGTGLSSVSHVGDTIQFLATGNPTGGTPQNLTSSVQWISSNAGVATISASGLATATGPGTTLISAVLGGKVATSDFTVTLAAGLPASLALIPGAGAAVSTRVGETTQFLAFGSLGGGGTVQDLTNKVRWVSSDTSVATIDQAGLATGVGATGNINQTTITAIATTSNGAVLTAITTMMVTPITGTVKLPTLALYKVGAGSGTVTTVVGTGINCGPQTSCTGNFPIGSQVRLLAVPAAGSSFGGWSSNCIPDQPNTPAAPNTTCTTVPLSTNDSVGAVFNTP